MSRFYLLAAGNVSKRAITKLLHLWLHIHLAVRESCCTAHLTPFPAGRNVKNLGSLEQGYSSLCIIELRTEVTNKNQKPCTMVYCLVLKTPCKIHKLMGILWAHTGTLGCIVLTSPQNMQWCNGKWSFMQYIFISCSTNHSFCSVVL